MVGRVTAEDNGTVFLLLANCKKKRLVIQIEYKGTRPVEKNEIIAYGKIRKNKEGGTVYLLII